MTHILGLQRKDINMASRFAPDSNMQAQMRYNRAERIRQQAEGLETDRNVEEKQNWQQAVKMAKDIGQTYQTTVNNLIESNLMKYSVPHGKFFVDPNTEQVTWKWNDNATVKKLPNMEEAWNTYRKAKLLSGQQPTMQGFYPSYNRMNAQWAQMMSGKLSSLSGAGYTAEDLKDALSDADLLENFGQVSTAIIPGPDGKSSTQAGTLLGPWTQPIIGKSDKGIMDYREDLPSAFGILPKGGGLAAGAFMGYQKGKEAIPRAVTKAKGAVSQKLAERTIAKRGIATNPTKVVGDMVKYLQTNSSDDLIKLVVKKGYTKKVAAKLAARIAAVSAAATLGTATAPTGIGAVAGYGAALWGLYDIYGIITEIMPEIQEKVFGDTTPVGF